MPNTHFHHQIYWKPTATNTLTNLNVLNDSVNTLITDVNALPDFDNITTANKFCITNTANGGTISYITPTTSNFNEGSNLYYTDDRVATKITTALQGGEIDNIVTNIIQAQSLDVTKNIIVGETLTLTPGSFKSGPGVLGQLAYDSTEKKFIGYIEDGPGAGSWKELGSGTAVSGGGGTLGESDIIQATIYDLDVPGAATIQTLDVLGAINADSLTLSGDLNVKGTKTTVNETILTIENKHIV